MTFIADCPHEILHHLKRWDDLQPGQHHNWLLRIACLWIRYGQSEENTRAMLRSFSDEVMHRTIPVAEVEGFVRYAMLEQDSDRTAEFVRWTGEFGDRLSLQVAFRRSREVQDRLDPLKRSTVDLTALYEPGELLCVGRSVRESVILPVEEIVPDQWQFIVPNPMRRVGPRTFSNIRRVEYRVVEWDNLPPTFQLRLLEFLNGYVAPLELAAWSGGKSWHGWLKVGDLSKAYRDEIDQVLWSLGADPSMARPNQWCRMPGGIRDNGEKQYAIRLTSSVDAVT